MSKRLDEILVDRQLAPTLEKARAIILAGEVWSKENRLEKPGTKYPDNFEIEIRSKKEKYVSRAGEKLHFAVETFQIGIQGKTCLDIGASTGGFTECLLTLGADFVFSVDVGYGLLDVNLRNHEKVKNIERTNARFLTEANLNLPEKSKNISLVVADVSFISLRSVLPQIQKEFKQVKEWIVLFKPQFEVGPENLRKGGIVKDSLIAQKALESFQIFMKGLHLVCTGGPIESPVTGKKSGNQEYLLYYRSSDPSVLRG